MPKSLYAADFTAASNVAAGAAESNLNISSATVTGSLTITDHPGAIAAIGTPAHMSVQCLKIIADPAADAAPYTANHVELIGPSKPTNYDFIVDIPAQSVNTDYFYILLNYDRASGNSLTYVHRTASGTPQIFAVIGTVVYPIGHTITNSFVSTQYQKNCRLIFRRFTNPSASFSWWTLTILDMTTPGSPAFLSHHVATEKSHLPAKAGETSWVWNQPCGFGFANQVSSASGDAGYSRVELKSRDIRFYCYPSAIAVSKTGVVVKLRGVGTSWTNTTTFAITNPQTTAVDPTSGTSITATSWISATEVNLTFTTGATVGVIEITDNTTDTAAGFLSLIAAATQPNPNLIHVDQNDANLCTFDITGLALGNSISPLTYQLYDLPTPNTTPSGGNAIGGATKPPFTYTCPSDGAEHYIKLVTSDSTGTPITKTTTSTRILPYQGGTVAVTVAGDSITIGAADNFALVLRSMCKHRRIHFANHARSGSKITHYAPSNNGSTYGNPGYSTTFNMYSMLLGQLLAFEADSSIATVICDFMSGANDANFDTASTATYQSEYQTNLDALLAATTKTIFSISDPTPMCAPYVAGSFGEATQALVTQYAATACDAIVAHYGSSRVVRGWSGFRTSNMVTQQGVPITAVIQPDGFGSPALSNQIMDGTGPHFTIPAANDAGGYSFMAGLRALRIAQIIGDVPTGSGGGLKRANFGGGF